ncbi:MAG: RNA polymerase sigma factor [Bacteroidota bacterium]|jgi:RNA polymerase sigma-70 factor (ECF subfamily)|nr:RNA polymerase sigma factor [Bacteroidota bacterium]
MKEQVIAQPLSVRDVEYGDDVLITRFQSGDESAFRPLMDRHVERVRNLIFSVFRSVDVVDDLTQDVFLKAYRALGQFRFDAAFSTWLYRIAINHCRDEMRKRRLRRVFSLHTLLERQDAEVTRNTAVFPVDHETRELIDRGLRRLPEKYRLPVILKDVEGLSYEEIADVLRCELGTVKSRLSRGRELLRRFLSPLLED